jgi:hypothetical protein
MGFHLEIPARLTPYAKRLLRPVDVGKFRVNQFSITQATFQAHLDRDPQ